MSGRSDAQASPHGIVGGKDEGATELRKRLNETATNSKTTGSVIVTEQSHGPRSRMRETRTSGNVELYITGLMWSVRLWESHS